ncbi:MAG: MFS transporter [Gemmataceae bacterium]|nr:MFS transporter [Gemmataceae bacterium]
MTFQPVDSLRSRTFVGLLIAQFLAAFNDQAIHASAMFFAINHKAMNEANAISLMPILFYAPWAIFCTFAGWLADRYSKRQSLVFWKIAEVAITATALLGFWIGTVRHHDALGPWIVLSTVFLMGTHSAFFVPAKYGAMPEILPPHLLSKGNGLLESLSFLAVILGTVSGGVLSFVFKGEEYYIGMILLALAIIGAVASFLIEKMPAANPTRPFPTNLFKPLIDNLRVMLRSKPLALAVLGIAFFTFMVAFMRGTMYMHGETRNPRWTELETSIVVGVVALGVGLGSPLAGFLSGGKIELGLVPLGALGMILSLVLGSIFLDNKIALVACLIGVGFFTGFYIVPLFTLLQHRAPKASKGDLLASANFINVVGAISASLLFKVLVIGAQWTGVTPSVPTRERAQGTLVELEYDEHGRPALLRVDRGAERRPFVRSSRTEVVPDEEDKVDRTIIETHGSPEVGSPVIVGSYTLERQGFRVVYFIVQPADIPLKPAYNNQPLTRYLFLGAGFMTLGILIVLCRQMPDFFVRSLLWARSLRRYRVSVIGLHNVPTDGPVILATNCTHLEDCMNVVSATDRFTRFILLDDKPTDKVGPLLAYLARRTGLIALPAGAAADAWGKALEKGTRALKCGTMVGVTADGQESPEMERVLEQMRAAQSSAVVPVLCCAIVAPANGETDPQGVRVVMGKPLPVHATLAEIQEAIRSLSTSAPSDESHTDAPLLH